MKKIIIGGVVLLIAVAGIIGFNILSKSSNSDHKTNKTICSSDAKQCADGSYVGRVSPDCKFAKCPEDK